MADSAIAGASLVSMDAKATPRMRNSGRALYRRSSRDDDYKRTEPNQPPQTSHAFKPGEIWNKARVTVATERRPAKTFLEHRLKSVCLKSPADILERGPLVNTLLTTGRTYRHTRTAHSTSYRSGIADSADENAPWIQHSRSLRSEPW
jgi:hypothetical protein